MPNENSGNAACNRTSSARIHGGATCLPRSSDRLSALAAAVLLGLAVVAIWPAGWPIDPVIALGIAVWSAWEGRQAWRGDDCC
jgi:hypothetical protein